MAEFFDMGGHGFYIWLSYAVAALLMIGLVVESVLRLKKNRKMLDILTHSRQLARQSKES